MKHIINAFGISTFLLVHADGVLVKLKINDEVKAIEGKTVTVVEGDDMKLTCRANKVLAKPPLTWTLNGKPLDQTAQEMWGMEVHSKQIWSKFYFSNFNSNRIPRKQNETKENKTKILSSSQEKVVLQSLDRSFSHSRNA